MGHKQRPSLAEARPAQNPQEREGCEPKQCCDHPAQDRSEGKRLDRRRFMRSVVGVSGAALAAGALTTRGGPLGASEAHAASDGSLRQRTAVVIIDPYNDFLSHSGAAWPAVGAVVRAVGVVGNLKKLLVGARSTGTQVVYAPHRRYRKGDYANWKFRNWSHNGIRNFKMFAHGTPRGEFLDGLKAEPGDMVALEHWSASGFANTDLNQILRQHGIDHVALAGMLTNTCVEATGREAVELGYHVAMIKDAVGCMSHKEQTAAVELSYPRFAHAILSTDEFLATLG